MEADFFDQVAQTFLSVLFQVQSDNTNKKDRKKATQTGMSVLPKRKKGSLNEVPAAAALQPLEILGGGGALDRHAQAVAAGALHQVGLHQRGVRQHHQQRVGDQVGQEVIADELHRAAGELVQAH